MDAGWDIGASATSSADGWDVGSKSVSFGSSTGRSYSNNTTLTGNDSGATGSGGYSGGGGGGYSRGLNPKAQISVERLPYETSVETIRNIFGRYGRISRVICDYKITEERLFVWLDYEDEKCGENAIRVENGRKMERNAIVVQKCANSSSDDGFRSRGPRKDAWGNTSWGSKGDRGGSSAAAGSSSGTDDWTSGGDWGTSTTDNADSGGADSSFGGDDRRRSGRGRGGGRDRGGGRGGRGGRYQPYDKDDSWGEKPAKLANWDDIVSGNKASTSSSSDWNATSTVDWAASGEGGSKTVDDWNSSDANANQPSSQNSTTDPYANWE